MNILRRLRDMVSPKPVPPPTERAVKQDQTLERAIRALAARDKQQGNGNGAASGHP